MFKILLFYVVAVSDFLFVQGTGVIFKVALCLLSSHEGEIVECDSFESIVGYLKNTIPALSQTQMEQTIAKVQRGKLSFVILRLKLFDTCASRNCV